MSEAAKTYEGWYAYHDFRKIDWNKWKSLNPSERQQMIKELLETIREFSTVEDDRQGSFGQYAILGHKADLLFIHLRPTMDELNEVKLQFDKTGFADVTSTPYSYISVVELSSYTIPPDVDPLSDPAFRERLQPILPKTQYVCFYPMNKRRLGDDNWYMLSSEERRRMMRSHGLIGRSYAGKVRQIITGSVGFDDWEWGVSLFSDDPLNFKKLVYEMRFDEVSARFGEFGPFYVGCRLTDEGLSDLLSKNIKG
ncbi:hydrogen peroxide-dependent heme synthase [Thermoflavimicrobium dichotomicum]|uniref:Coproheme decarboxylase n=1 Tax=Thermoflavimicrobium dichotomicum TaxID=46223 RepID=A0A1I3KH65_9BACL|nr:hydrogen peroxide-dependent heme synthase [Thermoflavimicrobium dichotomicum]SFI71744.1 chlorite dismutase [Thermoflavimicrobium dichotomicum]